MGNMNKKGLFFTVISVVLISIVIIAFVTTTQDRTQDEIEITSLRIESADSFVKFLEKTQFERAVKASTVYSLSSFSRYIEDNDDYLPERNVYFALFKSVLGVECGQDYDFLSAELKQSMNNPESKQGICSASNPHQINSYNQYMQAEGYSDQTIPGILNDIDLLAKDTGLSFSYIINDLSFELKDAWTIQVDLDLTYNVNNSDNTLSFSQENVLMIDVPIAGQRDPLYVKNDYDKYIHNNDDASVNEVLPWRFVENNQAPSYFKRLVGDSSADEKGIQSVFNPTAYDPNRISLGGQSYVDYEYFKSGKSGTCRKVSNIFINLADEDQTFYEGKNVNVQDCQDDDFIDCGDDIGWKNADPLSCGTSCTDLNKSLLIYRYCGSASNPNIQSKCVEDSNGNPANACQSNCDNPNHCGDGILNKLCEECEPGPGISCTANCKTF